MSEYIVEWSGIGARIVELLKSGTPLCLIAKRLRDERRREEIVRCRDCRHFYEDRRCSSIGWVGVFVCDSEQWSTSSLMPSHKVEPDGFCAWGERRDA